MMKQVIQKNPFKYDIVSLKDISPHEHIVLKSSVGVISILEMDWTKGQLRLISANKIGLAASNGQTKIGNWPELLKILHKLLEEEYEIFTFDHISEMYQWLADELK